jgi:hypothetical protein
VEATLAALAPTVQAALPTLSAIAQSEQVQSTLRSVGEVLAGVHVEIDQSPGGVPPSQVTRAAVSGSDASGAFRALDPIARLAAAQAALAVLGQVYPNAVVELTISGGGGTVLTGRKPPGGTPSVDLQP